MIEPSPAMRIFVIDDNPDDRHLALREIRAVFPDAQMVEVTNFDEFNTALATGPPDLVLTDLDLRWTNGRQVLLTVKALCPACPVVMLTGTGNETIAVDLMKAGLDDYVVKSSNQLARLRASLKIAVKRVMSGTELSEHETHLQSVNERLAALARTDDLTGLANRRALRERLADEWARVVRYRRSLAAVAIDIDHFKHYNDHLGHQAGDECLRKVAGALGAAGRATDFAARSGGEEFVILLPETNLVGAEDVAENVRTTVEMLGIRHPLSVTGVVTVSVGVAAATADVCGTPEALLEAADKALYSAKREGRNRVAVASPQDPS